MSAARGPRLDRAWLERETPAVARALLGALLVHDAPEGRTVGRIVETEAYLSVGDPASHSHAGRTARNAAMFGPAGTAYVYFIYGLHHCLNVVTAAEGVGEAVLLRALEPLEGLELMRERRGIEDERRLCRGPANLVRAMGVGREHDGVDLGRGPLHLLPPARRLPAARIASGPRVGIRAAAERRLRFFVAESRFVSRG